MSIREKTETLEYQVLSERAVKAAESRGRVVEETPCDIRTIFQRDRDRIIHSKSFRRLKHKTQVFLSPEGDHYRTRLTHTLEVAQISRTIARALRLNEDLTEAIALGHDLGHTPFGHCGEYALSQIHPDGFEHNVQSLRMVDVLEKHRDDKPGLNLSEEVRDGILNHRGSGVPFTLEGQVVKTSDRIAYINHDIDDALRAGVLHIDTLPKAHLDILGNTHSQRINFLILDLIEHSLGSEKIGFSKEVDFAFLSLRHFMFEHVYLNFEAKKEEAKAMGVIKTLYLYFQEHPESMPSEHFSNYQNGEGDVAVKDYIAGMTDRYAVQKYKDLFIPNFWV
jgi:dGTPase